MNAAHVTQMTGKVTLAEKVGKREERSMARAKVVMTEMYQLVMATVPLFGIL
jgi:hypothetical protein